jgi:outer membrane protein OmpA-like peptidoglycan-associated protein
MQNSRTDTPAGARRGTMPVRRPPQGRTRRSPRRGTRRPRPVRAQPGYQPRRIPTARDRFSRAWTAVVVLLAVGAAAVVVAFSIRAHAQTCTTANDTIVWAAQVTAEEGSTSTPPPGLIARADALASCGGGQLVLIKGAGQGGVQAGPAVSLRIYRAPGELENDPTVRAAAVQQLVDKAFRYAATVQAPGDGRDVIGLLGAISAELGSGQTDVWLRTLGLPTVAPADARILMAADPAQAVASIANWVPSLHGARVHLILSPSAGRQPRLNTATDAWRLAFMVDLLRQAGADVVSVQQDQIPEQAAPGAPSAPVVANLPEPTPTPAAAPRPVANQPYRISLDSATFFLPNSTQFATSRDRVLAELEPIVAAWRTGQYAQVRVVGHCAMFGPRLGAVELSMQRAAIVAGLLRQLGITDVISTGVGYDDPLPPNPYSPSNRVVVITAIPEPDD